MYVIWQTIYVKTSSYDNSPPAPSIRLRWYTKGQGHTSINIRVLVLGVLIWQSRGYKNWRLMVLKTCPCTRIKLLAFRLNSLSIIGPFAKRIDKDPKVDLQANDEKKSNNHGNENSHTKIVFFDIFWIFITWRP